MADYYDVTLRLDPGHGEHKYRVQLEDVGTERKVGAGFDLNLEFLATLFAKEAPGEYGNYLYDAVFRNSSSDGEVGLIHHRLKGLMNRAEDEGATGLRLRLLIATTVPKLHGVVWECLSDVPGGLYLSADGRLTLYRDLEVDRNQGKATPAFPSVLAAVVSPTSGLRRWQLEPLNVKEEELRLGNLFATLRSTLLYEILASKGQGGGSALERIETALDDGQFQVLHLSCHGVIKDGRAWLMLSDEDGRADPVHEEDFRDLFKALPAVRLVVLDACQSAQASQARAFAGLAPQLVTQVPAAIGMQRPWYTGVADDRFTRAFYRNLFDHGYVDRALQYARRRLRRWKPARWEWSTPALYLRLEDGLLFGPEPDGRPRQGEREAQAAPERQGGAVFRLGAGAQMVRNRFKGDFAAGNIYDGYDAPEKVTSGPAGTVFDVGPDARLEGNEFFGRYAAGSIITQRLRDQARQPFGPNEQRAAHQAQIEYYRDRLERLEAALAKEESEPAEQMQAEISDLREEIRDQEEKLADDRW